MKLLNVFLFVIVILTCAAFQSEPAVPSVTPEVDAEAGMENEAYPAAIIETVETELMPSANPELEAAEGDIPEAEVLELTPTLPAGPDENPESAEEDIPEAEVIELTPASDGEGVVTEATEAEVIELTPSPETDSVAVQEDTGIDTGQESGLRALFHHHKLLLASVAAAVISAGGLVVTVLSQKKRKSKMSESERESELVTQMDEKTDISENRPQPLSPYTCGACLGQGKRAYQEDSLWYTARPGFGEAGLYVIADGMGGMDNGKESSTIASRYFEQISASISPQRDIPAQLRRCAQVVNQQVYQNNSRKGMNGGTTLVCAYLFKNNFYWLSVGDSRIYLYRDGILSGVNEEHELENRLYGQLLDGSVSLSDVRSVRESELRKLTSNIGRDAIPIIDQNYFPFPLRRGDRILLCSDGVSGTLSEADMITCLADRTAEQSALMLGKMVQAAGKPHQDNFSAIVIVCETEDGQ